MSASLARLFDPRSIAVVGASRDASSVSGQPLVNLREHGYAGRLFPVNPKYSDIDGLECFARVADVPECPDLAIIVVGARHVPGVLRECGERGVPFALIISSGFAEAGPEGQRLQDEVDAVVRRFGIRVVGPNCQGMMNVTEGLFAGFGAAFQIPRLAPGPVSLVTQSGGFGYAVVSMAEEAGVGFRHVVCTGNESGITTLDFMQHFIADPHTRILAGYVEGLKDARRLLDVGDQALAAGKPIMIWKVGRSEAGQRAAVSHTANLGGANELYRALFRQRGILEVEDVQDLADYSRAFLGGREPRGPRVGVVTISGGAGVVMADACAELGLATPPLSARSAQKLREIVPAFGSIENPVDVTGNIFNDPRVLPAVLRVVADDENVDSLVVMTVLVQGKLAQRFAADIVALQREIDKPIVLCWSARAELAVDAYAMVDAEAIPRYPTPIRTARALRALTLFAEAKRRRARRAPGPTAVSGGNALDDDIGGSGAMLTEREAKRVLARFGIPVTREGLARSGEEAARIAAEIGFPVALKVSSVDIPHKTECGGVRVGLDTPSAVAAAYDEILRAARGHHPGAGIEGVLVQEMVSGGVEVILGLTHDARFGPAIMFGLGGIHAEILRDCAFRICPIDRDEALEMVRETRGFALLEGARGAARCDVQALADAVHRLSAMALALGDRVAELDINPLFVLPEGRGVVAADALIRLRSTSGERTATSAAHLRATTA